MNSDLERISSTGEYELWPCIHIGPEATLTDPGWQVANKITHAMCCAEESDPDLLGAAASVVTTNLIPLPEDGDSLPDDGFAEMMSDASDFVREAVGTGRVALFGANMDRVVVCVVAYLCTKRESAMRLDEALRTVKDRLPDYFMSQSYHAKLKRWATQKSNAKKNLEPGERSKGKKKGNTGARRERPPKNEPKKGESFFIECPHCAIMLEITNVRCGTFRCGVYKKNGRPLPPHSSQMVCEDAAKKGLIYGCGLPFKYNGIDPPVALSWEDAKSWGGKGAQKGGKG